MHEDPNAVFRFNLNQKIFIVTMAITDILEHREINKSAKSLCHHLSKYRTRAMRHLLTQLKLEKKKKKKKKKTKKEKQYH